jgi:hypothetical protein
MHLFPPPFWLVGTASRLPPNRMTLTHTDSRSILKGDFETLYSEAEEGSPKVSRVESSGVPATAEPVCTAHVIHRAQTTLVEPELTVISLQMMTIALHSRLIGRPGRLQGLKQCVYVLRLRLASCVPTPAPHPAPCILIAHFRSVGIATRPPR